MTEANISIEDAQGSSPEKTVKIAHISGQLDESNIDEKIREIYQVVEQNPKELSLVLDLKDLEYMNSKSIGYITDIYGKLTENGGQMAIANAKSNILDILQVVGLTQLIKTYNSTDEAISSMTVQSGQPAEPQPEQPAAPQPEPPVEQPQAEAQPEPPAAPQPEPPAEAQPEQPAAPQPEPPVEQPQAEAPAAPQPEPEPPVEQPQAEAQPEPPAAPQPEPPAEPQPEQPAEAPAAPQPEPPAKDDEGAQGETFKLN